MILSYAGKITNNDEALIDDLMVILKKEVSSRKTRNVDVLNISSLICHKLSGTLILNFFSFQTIILIFRYQIHQL